MIGLDQWRCTIGLFMFRSQRKRCTSNKKQKQKQTGVFTHESDWSDTCGRLFVMAVTLWFFHLQHQVISEVMATNCFDFDFLKQCPDVEKNPGPGPDTSFDDKLQRFSDNIMRAIGEVKATVEEVKATQNEVKTQLKEISDSVDTMKKDLSSVTDRVKHVEEDQEIQRLDIEALLETIAALETRVHELEVDAEKQSQYSRRENIILHGVAEESNEDYEKIRKRVTQIFNNNVKCKTWQETDILRSHRLGNQPLQNKARPIIVRLLHFHDKLSILKARSELKKCAIGVASDLTKKQRSELAKLKEKNQKGYYKNGTLHVIQNGDSGSPMAQQNQQNR